MKGSRRRGGWCVLLRFKRLPRTFVSCTEVHGTIRASLFLSLVVEWAGSPPLSFPSIRARVNVSLNPRSSYNEPLRIGNTRFSQTRLHSHSRTHEQTSKIFVPDFAPPYPLRGHSFARAERRKEGRREKRQRERRRGSEIKR